MALIGSERQLTVFAVIAVAVIGSATWLAGQKAIDPQAYVALVGAISGGIVGMLNPAGPKPN